MKKVYCVMYYDVDCCSNVVRVFEDKERAETYCNSKEVYERAYYSVVEWDVE